MEDIFARLRANSYPGRGIILGRSADGKRAVAAYFIMGRSENSRNRVFERTEDGIRTRAYDEAKVVDPSLILYHPVWRLDDRTLIVTNGDHTDTIKKHMLEGHCYRHGLHARTFEPDGPNYTPRISGVINPAGQYAFSILKSLDGNPACCCRYFFEYETPQPGMGHFISTYQGDGDPLPSFVGEPVAVALVEQTAAELADKLWESLNEDNKVSLYVCYQDLATGEQTVEIRNVHA